MSVNSTSASEVESERDYLARTAARSFIQHEAYQGGGSPSIARIHPQQQQQQSAQPHTNPPPMGPSPMYDPRSQVHSPPVFYQQHAHPPGPVGAFYPSQQHLYQQPGPSGHVHFQGHPVHGYPGHGHPGHGQPARRPDRVLVSDDIVSGSKRNGWMSPVRRFFVLFVTFDFILTALLWAITVIVTGRDLMSAIEQQIMEYTIHDSMFDCVLGAFLRFFILIACYAILGIKHWWPIAITTSGTSAFVVAKVFCYQWTKFGSITFDVMLVLVSFILAWGEMWFMDIRVLPLEQRAEELAQNFEENERAPLLNDAVVQRYVNGDGSASVWEGSVANFYSPMESPEDSGDEMEEGTHIRVPKKFKRKHSLSQKEHEYKRLGQEALETAWRIMNLPDWKLEKRCDNGDSVHSKTIKAQGRNKKLFRLTGIIDIPPKLLLEELFYQIESVPAWNPTLVECKTIQPIDSHTDISYQVAAEGAGGVVSTRDFVNLRYWSNIEDVYFAAVVSVKHSAMPPQPKRVRGENGPGGWAIRGVVGDPEKCHCQWLLDTDLKGWIPQSIIDNALSGAQLDYIKYIRNYAAKLHESGKVREHLDELRKCGVIESSRPSVEGESEPSSSNQTADSSVR